MDAMLATQIWKYVWGILFALVLISPAIEGLVIRKSIFKRPLGMILADARAPIPVTIALLISHASLIWSFHITQNNGAFVNSLVAANFAVGIILFFEVLNYFKKRGWRQASTAGKV